MNGVHYRLSVDSVEMYCKVNRIETPIWSDQENLPIVYNYFVSTQDKKYIGLQIRSTMAYSNLSTLEFFGDPQTSKKMISGKNWI